MRARIIKENVNFGKKIYFVDYLFCIY